MNVSVAYPMIDRHGRLLSFVIARLPPCPVRAATGVPCPGCGFGRAVAFCFQGQFGAAQAAHPLAIMLVCQGVILSMVAATPLVRRSRLRSVLTVIGWVDFAALLSVWVFRLAAGTIP